MERIVALLLALASFTGINAATWPNEPAGSALVTDWGFSALSGSGWNNARSGAAIISDNTAPASAPSVLQFKYPVGMTDGISPGDVEYIYGNGGMDQYSSFWWKADSPFQNHPVLTKIFYVTNNNGNGHPFFFGMAGSSAPYTIDVSVQGDTRLDNRHIGAAYTSTWHWGSGGVLYLNRWHQIETYVRKSTTISSRDGILRVWVDGNMVINVTALNTDDAGPFSGVAIAPVFGGVAGAVKSQDDYFWFDHFRISRPNGNIKDPLYISSGILPSAQSGKAYSATIQVTGGKAPYAWTITSGSLLPGLSLNKATGVISGTPTSGGKCTFTAKVLDSDVPAAEVSKSFSIVASGTISVQNGNKVMARASQIAATPRGGSVLFRAPQNEAFSITVHDLAGRQVWRHAGNGEAVWNHGGQLNKGVYLVRMEQNGRTMSTNYCRVW